MNKALLSRSRLFELQLLSKEDIKDLILKAIKDKERGMGEYDVAIDEDALNFLADASAGDARMALNAIELGIMTTEKNELDGKIRITLEAAQNVSRKEL